MVLQLPFPSVPDLPGVPALARAAGYDAPAPVLLAQDDTSVAAPSGIGQWGLYDSAGNAPINPTSYAGFEYRGQWTISDYPIEGGGFESYNKVKRPLDARLVVTCGGTQADRAQFLTAIDSMLVAFGSYTIVTPEQSYPNLNPVVKDLARTEKNGVTLLTVQLWFEEILIAPDPSYSNTQAASGADPVNGGSVQPLPAASAPGLPTGFAAGSV